MKYFCVVFMSKYVTATTWSDGNGKLQAIVWNSVLLADRVYMLNINKPTTNLDYKIHYKTYGWTLLSYWPFIMLVFIKKFTFFLWVKKKKLRWWANKLTSKTNYWWLVAHYYHVTLLTSRLKNLRRKRNQIVCLGW